MYRRDHTRLQERSYPFTGEIIPVYRRDHTRLQERSYPFTGEIIPVYRRDHTRLRGSPSPIIPIYRKNYTHLQVNHTRLQDIEIAVRKTKSCRVIPVYRRKAAPIIPVID